MAKRHTVVEVSFAQTCQLPATTAANPEFEGGEGVITKRCFVLLSVRDDDGATTEVVIDWTQSSNCEWRLIPSLPRSKNAIQNLWENLNVQLIISQLLYFPISVYRFGGGLLGGS